MVSLEAMPGTGQGIYRGLEAGLDLGAWGQAAQFPPEPVPETADKKAHREE